MNKIIILTSEHGYIDAVLRVENYDENFLKLLDAALQHWYESTDEYHEVIEKHLSEAGYAFTFVNDYITIDDPTG